MASFSYRAVGAQGELLHGELNAADRARAVAQLQARGALPLRVQEAETNKLKARLLRMTGSGSRVPQGALVDMLLRLATLLGGGVPIEDALEMLAQRQGAPSARQLARELLRQLREGTQLADAMEDHGQDIPPIVVGMVRAGEISGALADTLARLAEYMQRSEAARQAVRSALVYPAILLVTASFSILIVLTVVLPALRPAIMDNGGVLPLPTRMAFAASDLIVRFWWVLAILAAGGGLALRYVLTDASLRIRRDTALLRMPVVGNAVRQAEVARFARTLGVLVDGGVALPTALALAQPVISNAVLADAVAQVILRLREGDGLAEPLAQSDRFPDLAIQLVRIGEATGRLGAMLLQLADIFDADVRRTMERGLAVLVPVLTIGLGLMVAGIVASVVLALLNVNDFIK
jgi:general secretion pathway protein F